MGTVTLVCQGCGARWKVLQLAGPDLEKPELCPVCAAAELRSRIAHNAGRVPREDERW